MKAILGITLCVLTAWMTILSPQPVFGDRTAMTAMEMVEDGGAAITTEIGIDPGVPGTMLTAELAATEGGWWNWVRKILRAILDLIPGGDDDPGDEPQD